MSYLEHKDFFDTPDDENTINVVSYCMGFMTVTHKLHDSKCHELWMLHALYLLCFDFQNSKQ
jgi:hypothetical protein